jgi:uncharacterized protein YdaU (DUF1376 family)
MSKDPAFLFYPQDFITGTMFMNNEQVGLYVRLLCAQHQHGGIIDKDLFNQTVQNVKIVKDKFIESEDGFYNQRLMDEMVKRKKKSSNLSLNALKRWEKEKEYKGNAIALPKHMPIENENEDVNVNVIKKNKRDFFQKPTLDEVLSYCKERNGGVDGHKFFNYYESNGWKVGKNTMKNWKAAVHTWEKNIDTKEVKTMKPNNLL